MPVISQGKAPDFEELQIALENRAAKLNEQTQGRAHELLVRSGERAAAPFLAAHEALNRLFENLTFQDPKLIEAFSVGIFETMRGMTDAIVMGNSACLYQGKEMIGYPRQSGPGKPERS